MASFLFGARCGSPLFGRPIPRSQRSTLAPKPGPKAHPKPLAFEPEPSAAARSDTPLPLPGEFETQAAIILGAHNVLRICPEVFTDVVQAACRNVPLVCLVASRAEAQQILKLLLDRGLPADAVRFLVMPIDSMWVRDYGPLFLRRPDGSVTVADLDYSWKKDGRPTTERGEDNAAPRLLAEVLGLPVERVPLRLAGGNLLTNGEGLYVTTSRALASNADRTYQPDDVGNVLINRLGAKGVVMMPRLLGEPSGHVDMLMTFLAPDVAVVGRIDAATDPTNAALLDQAAAALARMTTSRGPMRVYRIPMPPPVGGYWRSYTNVLFANGTLLMPRFSDVPSAIEEEVMALYARLLPGWKIVGIDSRPLAQRRGMLHCISLNVPSYVSIAPFLRTAAPSRPLAFARG